MKTVEYWNTYDDYTHIGEVIKYITDNKDTHVIVAVEPDAAGYCDGCYLADHNIHCVLETSQGKERSLCYMGNEKWPRLETKFCTFKSIDHVLEDL